jgi:hypothetical protein
LTLKISTPLDRRFYGFYKEDVIDNVAEVWGGDSIQYRILRDFGAAREHRGCAKSSVERFRYFAFGCHSWGSFRLVIAAAAGSCRVLSPDAQYR